MNDKTLLELAAKAAGLTIDKSPYNGGGHGNTGFDMDGNAVLDWHNGKTWNPLTDDGDLYRLARAVGIDISFSDKSAYKRLPDGKLIQTFWGEIPDHPNDKVDDEAHAIVRCAAEIWRSL